MPSFGYSAVRTPFGPNGGALSTTPDLDPARIDDVVYGNANGAGEDNRDIGRKVLHEHGERGGVAAICIGVGQGLAVVLESTR